MPKALDITNQKFGKLTAIKKMPSKNGKTYWLCVCDCGKEKVVQTCHLIDGRTKSCGCGYEQEGLTKKCVICGKEFQPLPSGTSRRYCFDCSPSYKTTEERSTSIIQLRRAMKAEAVKRFGNKCSRCGYDKNLGALEFHHKDASVKKFGLSQGGNTHSWEEYWEEAQQCELLCANCHAEQHSNM